MTTKNREVTRSTPVGATTRTPSLSGGFVGERSGLLDSVGAPRTTLTVMADKQNRTSTSNDGFTADERDAMKARAAELRADAKREKGAVKAAAELQDALDAIAKMADSDRALAERVHEIVLKTGPSLGAKTWYGMPAYALDGKVVFCFFQAAGKFDARYCTFGFNDPAALDEGTMWPTAFALTAIGPAEEKRIAELVRRAVGAESDDLDFVEAISADWDN